MRQDFLVLVVIQGTSVDLFMSNQNTPVFGFAYEVVSSNLSLMRL